MFKLKDNNYNTIFFHRDYRLYRVYNLNIKFIDICEKL